MNRPLRRVAIAVMVLLLALLINDNVVQVVEANGIKNQPWVNGNGNERLVFEAYAQQRGEVVAGGQNIAFSVPTGDEFTYKRQYANGPMDFPITGYTTVSTPQSGTFTAGQMGLEFYENSLLQGTDSRLASQQLSSAFTGNPQRGGSVVTTINPKAQQAAYQGLTSLGPGSQGAAVAIEPSTGKILALVSTPSFDPNQLATQSLRGAGAAQGQFSQQFPTRASIDQAIYGTYPPGSTFKLVTGSAALSHGYTPSTAVPVGAAYSPLPQEGGQSLTNEGFGNCGSDTLDEGLRRSCNTVYGYVGANLAWSPGQQQQASPTQQIQEFAQSQQILQAQADAFGFGQGTTIPMQAVTSCIQKIAGACSTQALDQMPLANTAIGQESNQVTPLQMAMVASAIANKGKLMQPYLVDQERAPDLSVINQTQPQPLDVNGDGGQAISPEVAQQMTGMMEDVVNNGTATNAKIPGVQVAGKTGTAQNGVNNANSPFAWFVAFAPANNPSVAVAVVESDPNVARDNISGNGLAAPIAKSIIQAVIGQ